VKESFWKNKWKKNEIGFHLDEVNPHLEKFFSKLELNLEDQTKGTILFPLCGKSKDMIHLNKMGYHVTGVEFSELAIHQFFDEQDISLDQVNIEERGKFKRYSYKDITILQGDFFHIDKDSTGAVLGIIDRAAFVAIDPAMRKSYAEQLITLSHATAPIFMVTLQYETTEIAGPPFSVTEANVKEVFAEKFDLQMLCAQDCLLKDKFQITENIWTMKPKKN
jgi:thiopurine S-methyltransferase